MRIRTVWVKHKDSYLFLGVIDAEIKRINCHVEYLPKKLPLQVEVHYIPESKLLVTRKGILKSSEWNFSKYSGMLKLRNAFLCVDDKETERLRFSSDNSPGLVALRVRDTIPDDNRKSGSLHFSNDGNFGFVDIRPRTSTAQFKIHR